jgi:NAD(P)-dependent dehydrogenase (short-subunit alcohol dehydrogenase family)
MPASTLGILILVQKCTMVIGGTFGIGRGSAIDLACAGANVVVTSRFVDAVHDVAGENEAIGRKGIPLTSDVLDRNSLQLLHESVGSSLGRVESGSNMGGLSHLTRSRPIVPARPRVVPLHSRLRWSGPAVAYA